MKKLFYTPFTLVIGIQMAPVHASLGGSIAEALAYTKDPGMGAARVAVASSGLGSATTPWVMHKITITPRNLNFFLQAPTAGLVQKLKLSDINDDELLRVCQRCPNLLTLNLWNCNITDAGLEYLAGLTNLQSLNLAYCRQITDAGLAHLTPLTRLKSLYLRYCRRITDAGLSHLTSLIRLQSLCLEDNNNITDASLAHLAGLTNLLTLDLEDCYQITDAGLGYLAGLTNLQSLNLEGCYNITNAGLAHLAPLINLQSLNLASNWTIPTQITDVGLAHLAELRNLQSLNLEGCRRTTYTAVQTLQAALPRCEIRW